MNQIVSDIRDRVGEPYADCCSTSNTTGTRTFLDILRAAKPDQQLFFQLDEAPLVAAGYHVTEVKAVTYNTMDCGEVADKWKETVIQLWNPGDEPEREYMTVRKFLAIYERVAEHIPVSYDAEGRANQEYACANPSLGNGSDRLRFHADRSWGCATRLVMAEDEAVVVVMGSIWPAL